MNVRIPGLVSFLSALLAVFLLGCAPSPPPEPTADPFAYPAPNATADPINYAFVASIVVSEVESTSQGMNLIPYPSETSGYPVIEIHDNAVTLLKLNASGQEEPATLADIVPRSYLEIAGEEKVIKEGDTITAIHLLARRVLIVEAATAAIPATPLPRFGEPGYPAPVTPEPAALITPTPAPYPTVTPCNPCGPERIGESFHLVGVVEDQIEGPTTTRLVLMPTSAYFYQYVLVNGDTEITFEDWSPATLNDIPPETIIDVVGTVVGGPDIRATYIIILDPATANPPPYYNANDPHPTAYP